MDLESQLTAWYVDAAFKKGIFGTRPRSSWSWPTVEAVCNSTGMDEDELRASVGGNVVIRNGKVGLARNPKVRTVGGGDLYNPNSGF